MLTILEHGLKETDFPKRGGFAALKDFPKKFDQLGNFLKQMLDWKLDPKSEEKLKLLLRRYYNYVAPSPKPPESPQKVRTGIDRTRLKPETEQTLKLAFENNDPDKLIQLLSRIDIIDGYESGLVLDYITKVASERKYFAQVFVKLKNHFIEMLKWNLNINDFPKIKNLLKTYFNWIEPLREPAKQRINI